MYEVSIGEMYVEDYDVMTETETTTQVSMDGLLSNWFFVGGVTAAMLALSIVFGLLLAKHRIKKGFDVYED